MEHFKLLVAMGNTPLNFEWNTGAESSTLTNLGSGSYSVIITDSWGFV